MTMRWFAAVLMAGLMMAAAPVSAAPKGDWPCIQRRVPALSMGTFWSGAPVDDAAVKGWRQDDEVAKLVARLVSRRTAVKDAEKLAGTFAAAQSTANARRVTLAFAGVFYELDTLRSSLIRGIERFTRSQRRLAKDVNKDRAELDKLRALPKKTSKQTADIEALQTKLLWQARLHKERESTLRYVCETPVLLEQRVFAIARALQNGM